MLHARAMRHTRAMRRAPSPCTFIAMQVSESDLFDEDDMGSEAGDMGGSEVGEDAGDMQSDMASEAQRPVHICTHVWGLCMYMYARICGGAASAAASATPDAPRPWAWELLRSSRTNGP